MTCDASFTIKGGKVGILLLHRLCGTPVEMRFVASGLAKHGYTVHCPQLAGHCGTDAELAASTWVDWYRSAEQALIELRRDCDVVIVGGLSTGAVLALMLAAKHPAKVQATSLMAPTLWLNGWNVPFYTRLFRLAWTKRIASLFSISHNYPNGIKDDRIRDFIKRARTSCGSAAAQNPSTPGASGFEHRQLVKAILKLVPYIRQPSLIIHPLDDDFSAMSNATYLRDHLTGATELVILDDCYHIVTVDRQRHLVVEAIDRFAQAFGSGATDGLVTVRDDHQIAVA